MNTDEIRPLHTLTGLAFDTQLTFVVARISEVYPARPAPGGSRQEIRIGDQPGGVGVWVNLFDQAQPIPQKATGGIIRITGSPNARNPIAWERSKAAKPSSNTGTLIVRKNAFVELLLDGSLELYGPLGYRSVLASAPVEPPQRPAPSPVASPQSRVADAPADGCTTAIEQTTRFFAECLMCARRTLGPGADPEDVRATAKITFAHVYTAGGGR